MHGVACASAHGQASSTAVHALTSIMGKCVCRGISKHMHMRLLVCSIGDDGLHVANKDVVMVSR